MNPEMHSPKKQKLHKQHCTVQSECQSSVREGIFGRDYKLNPKSLPSLEIIPFTYDEETKLFLDKSYAQFNSTFTSLYHKLAYTLFNKIGYTKTDILGKLDIGHLFLLSKENIDRLGLKKGDKLLDIGAGAGAITQKFSHIYQQLYATEVAPAMIKRLK
jgi:hypothetical protein